MSSRDNEGAVWKNKKRESDKHPHWTGSATIQGTDYWVSAWKKDDDAPENAPGIKFKFRPKDEAKKPRQETRQIESDFEPDTDIPF